MKITKALMRDTGYFRELTHARKLRRRRKKKKNEKDPSQRGDDGVEVGKKRLREVGGKVEVRKGK